MLDAEWRELKRLSRWFYSRVQCAGKAQCSGKHGFDSKQQAEKTMRHELRREACAYRCDLCGKWHIGSRAKGFRRVGT